MQHVISIMHDSIMISIMDDVNGPLRGAHRP